MRCLAFGDERATVTAPQLIAKVDDGIAHIQHFGAYHNLFIIVCRRAITAFGLGYGDEASVFALHIAIGKAQLPQQFDSAHFEPDEMI